MSAADLLQRLVAELDAASVPHMVAGSFASTFHGEPRTTFDIVIVIDPSLEAFEALLVSLRDEDYYLDRDVARDAFRRRSQFNLVDLATGWKVDLIVRKNRPFSVAEFERRRRGSILGVEVFVATAEDTIIAKLEWATLGASERQLRDIAGILSVRADALDLDYIEGWVPRARRWVAAGSRIVRVMVRFSGCCISSWRSLRTRRLSGRCTSRP